jgi:endonuclease G
MKNIILALALSIACFSTSCSKADGGSGSAPIPNPSNNQSSNSVYSWVHSIHTSLGAPKDKDTSDDYVIVRNQYVIDYNPKKGCPNWVSWELNSSWYGDAERYSGNFITDNTLPAYMYQVKHSDYTNSGYDRGHMVRSEERTDNDEDNRQTFMMTNIMPQTPDLNQGVWLKFEYFCEDLCKKQNKELFVVAGGIFHEPYKTLKDEGKVAIPDSCFKIVVVLEKGQTLANITKSTPIYAVVMPNISGVRKDDYAKYFTSVDRIESSVGYDFLSLIPDDIENYLEAKVSSN